MVSKYNRLFGDSPSDTIRQVLAGSENRVQQDSCDKLAKNKKFRVYWSIKPFTGC
jgi:hypothetical protein